MYNIYIHWFITSTTHIVNKFFKLHIYNMNEHLDIKTFDENNENEQINFKNKLKNFKDKIKILVDEEIDHSSIDVNYCRFMDKYFYIELIKELLKKITNINNICKLLLAIKPYFIMFRNIYLQNMSLISKYVCSSIFISLTKIIKLIFNPKKYYELKIKDYYDIIFGFILLYLIWIICFRIIKIIFFCVGLFVTLKILVNLI